MGVYIELPKEWARWSFDVVDIHCNSLVPKVTDLDLVRCGECKHWQGNKDEDDLTDLCKWITDELPNPDDFCSYGERRADE